MNLNNSLVGVGLDGNYSSYLEIIKPGELYLLRSRRFDVTQEEGLCKISVTNTEYVPAANSLFLETIISEKDIGAIKWRHEWKFAATIRERLDEINPLKVPVLDNLAYGLIEYANVVYLRMKNKEPCKSWQETIKKAEEIQKTWRGETLRGKIESYQENDTHFELIVKEFKPFQAYLDEATKRIKKE